MLFTPGEYVVHKTGGPVYIIKAKAAVGDGWQCERWNGSRHEFQLFTSPTLRKATSEEIAAMKKVSE